MNQFDINDTTPRTTVEQLMSLCEACQEGDFDGVKRILRKADAELDLNETDDEEWTPLHHAFEGGNLKIIQYLIDENGADLACIIDTQEGQDALNFAINGGHLDCIKYIAENGGDGMMDEENDNELRPLHLACLQGHFDIIQYLVEEHNVNTGAVDDDCWTALHYATVYGDLDIVRFLVEEHDVDVDATEVDGWTPFHCAANTGHLDVVKYLLEELQVDRDALVRKVRQNALHLASSEGRLNVVKYLIEEQDYDINELSSDEDTAFHLAATYGKLDVVKYFVEHARDDEARIHMLFAKNTKDQIAYDIAVGLVETENEYANKDLVDYLASYSVPLAVPSNDEDEDEPCVKLNPELSEKLRKVADDTLLRSVEETPVHEVAYHILGYLTLSDVKR